MLGLAAGDQRCDAERAYLPTVDLMVVAAVGDQPLRPASWSTRPAADRWDRLQQEQQLRAVVAVGPGDRPGERQPATVGQEVVLRTAAAPVDRARAGQGAPFFAW